MLYISRNSNDIVLFDNVIDGDKFLWCIQKLDRINDTLNNEEDIDYLNNVESLNILDTLSILNKLENENENEEKQNSILEELSNLESLGKLDNDNDNTVNEVNDIIDNLSNLESLAKLDYDSDKIIYNENKYVGVKSKKLFPNKLNSIINKSQKTKLNDGLYTTINYFKNKIQ
jgi:hypothetical protein